MKETCIKLAQFLKYSLATSCYIDIASYTAIEGEYADDTPKLSLCDCLKALLKPQSLVATLDHNFF